MVEVFSVEAPATCGVFEFDTNKPKSAIAKRSPTTTNGK